MSNEELPRKLKNFNRRKCLAVGNELIIGPMALFPPDDNGWLECDLKITLISTDLTNHESIGLFTDDTMNKAENFYAPILRYCCWNRTSDMSSNNDWPSSLVVKLGELEDENRFSKEINNFHKSLSEFNFIPHVLNKNRSTVEARYDVNSPSFELFCRNGLQGLTINSRSLKNDEFADRVHAMFVFMANQLKQFNHQGWKERFETDLEKHYPQKMWDRLI